MSTQQQTLLTQKQAAELLSLSPRTLEAWRLRGTSPPYLKLGVAVRYRLTDLHEWMAERSRISMSDDGSGRDEQ